MLDGLNVVQILRVGLAGLCFLLALLAFRLIQREQQRPTDPRNGILRAIYTFMVINIISALLVGAASYVERNAVALSELTSSDYLVDYTNYLVDATQWTPSTRAVDITRSDFVRKVSDTKSDFIIHYMTTGTEIKCTPITHGTQPIFDGPWQVSGDQRQHYDYHLPVGNQPATWNELISSRFTFSDGFKNPDHEWWQANVAYPAKTLSVVLRFPANKPAKAVRVSKLVGDNRPQAITDNPAVSPDQGYTYLWVGLHLEGKTRVQFDWDW